MAFHDRHQLLARRRLITVIAVMDTAKILDDGQDGAVVGIDMENIEQILPFQGFLERDAQKMLARLVKEQDRTIPPIQLDHIGALVQSGLHEFFPDRFLPQHDAGTVEHAERSIGETSVEPQGHAFFLLEYQVAHF